MSKIATPSDLDTELRRLQLSNRQGSTRDELAASLRRLSARLAGDQVKTARTYNLEDMARDMVGDGKSPNLFFSTDNKGKVLAIVAGTKTDGIKVGKALGAYLVEDRKTGEVWGSPAYEKAQMITDDNDD
jgi:hypothetical protein